MPRVAPAMSCGGFGSGLAPAGAAGAGAAAANAVANIAIRTGTAQRRTSLIVIFLGPGAFAPVCMIVAAMPIPQPRRRQHARAAIRTPSR